MGALILVGFFDDVKATLATFASTEGFNVTIVASEAVDNATVGSIEVENTLFAGGTNLANPLLGLMLDFVGALALIISNVNINASNLSIASYECHRNDMLKGAQVVGVLTNKKRIHAGARHG